MIPVAHLPTFFRMWDNSSAVVPKKLPRYLVPVVILNPRWLKRALVRSTIADFTTKINLVGLGNYPLAGPLANNKLKTSLISSKFTPGGASSTYHVCSADDTAAFNCRAKGSITIP